MTQKNNEMNTMVTFTALSEKELEKIVGGGQPSILDYFTKLFGGKNK